MALSAHSNELLAGYGDREDAMRAYLEAGSARAAALGNRGPVRYGDDGRLAEDILEAYWRTGFYVFTNVVQQSELRELEADLNAMWARLPVTEGADTDASGQPPLTAENEAPTLFWSAPLADPFGGTELANGRHPARMFEPQAAPRAPAKSVYLILGILQFSDACLRLYGHPDLLRIAAAVNGDDFTPFNEALFVKQPGIGASVAWHQDGVTHWDSPDLDPGTHGFNFQVQLYGSTAANALWVVPGSHRHGKLDIKTMVERAGSDRLPDAVPVLCGPGDVSICNRQTVHGSFANVSPDARVSLNLGFHRRRSVLGIEAGGVHNDVAVYDDARIRQRTRVLGYAINARRTHYPHEATVDYAPLADTLHEYCWNDRARSDLRDYNALDLSI